MGLGDDLMAVGRARGIHESNGKRVVMQRSGNSRYWSPMFYNVPWIVQHDERAGDATPLIDCPGRRPYIDYAGSHRRQVLQNGYRATRGELFFSVEEQTTADLWLRTAGMLNEPFIAVEPNIKGTFSGPNKGWIWERWEDLVERLQDDGHAVVQVSKPHATALRAPDDIVNLEVRNALAVLSRAKLVITTEGLLHHAAAALGVPAVVIWGGRTEPKVLGYPEHANIYIEGPLSPCGSLMEPCEHCEACMDAITVEMVFEKAKELLCASPT